MNKVKKFKVHEERVDTRRHKEAKKREQERRKAREFKQLVKESENGRQD